MKPLRIPRQVSFGALTYLVSCVPLVQAAVRLEGVVIDRSGEPVPYAQIRLLGPTAGASVEETESEGNGRFRLPMTANGPYTIQIDKLGFASSTIKLRERVAESQMIAVVLVHLGAISGRVATISGEALSGAMVFAQRAGKPLQQPQSLPPGHFSRVNPADGTYRLFDLAAGTYLLGVASGTPARLTAFYPGTGEPEPLAVPESADLRNIDLNITRSRAFRIAGAILGPPNGTYHVSLVNRKRPDVAMGSALTGDAGVFSIASVPDGSYSLLVSGPVTARRATGAVVSADPLFGRTDIDVAGEDLNDIEIKLAKPRTASFALATPEDAGCGLNTVLHLAPVDAWGSVPPRTEAMGPRPVVVSGLAPGSYRISVSGPPTGCLTTAEKAIDLSLDSAQQRVFSVPVAPAGSVRGAVLDWRNAITVNVELAATNGDALSPPAETLTPQDEGRFAFSGLAAGAYTLTVRRVSKDESGRLRVQETRKKVELRPGQHAEESIDAK